MGNFLSLCFISSKAIEIYISRKEIIGKCDFNRFTTLKKINCSHNQITELNNLPNCLEI